MQWVQNGDKSIVVVVFIAIDILLVVVAIGAIFGSTRFELETVSLETRSEGTSRTLREGESERNASQ